MAPVRHTSSTLLLFCASTLLLACISTSGRTIQTAARNDQPSSSHHGSTDGNEAKQQQHLEHEQQKESTPNITKIGYQLEPGHFQQQLEKVISNGLTFLMEEVPDEKDDGLNKEASEGDGAETRIDAIGKIRLGNISIGTPPQQLLMRFPLDQTDFWVVDARVHLYERYSRRKKARYDNSTSTTSVYSGDIIRMESGRVKGLVYNDTVTIGSVSVENVPFCSAYSLTEDFIKDGSTGLSMFDGTFGLNYAPTAGITQIKIPSPSRSFLPKLPGQIITIWQEPIGFGNVFEHEAVNKGSIMLGAENTVDCEPSYSRVEFGRKWTRYGMAPTVNAKSLLISGTEIKLNETRKMIIADIFGVYVSYEESADIAKAIGARKIQKGIYQVNCDSRDSLPPISFRVENYSSPYNTSTNSPRAGNNATKGAGEPTVADFVLDKYVIQIKKKLCVLAIMGTFSIVKDGHTHNPIIIGLQTLQNKCLSIDYENHLIGFSNGVGK